MLKFYYDFLDFYVNRQDFLLMALPGDQDSLPAAWLVLAWTFVPPESRQARKF